MKKSLYFLISLICILLWSSCRKDFDFEPAQNSQLSFSSDTIFLDTLFTNIRSSTKILKVYNNSNDDISISQVKLRRGTDSKYQLNIDGLPNDDSSITTTSGKVFENVEILAKDSIFVFVEATIDPTTDEIDLENNYLDELQFQTSNGLREVQLFTKVIDADFSFNENPDRQFITEQRDEKGDFIVLKGYNLKDSELDITKDKARVIYGNAVVPTGKTLTINAGSRIHFHRDSGLIIEDGANLTVIGEISPTDTDNPFKNGVIIEGDRIDEDFDNLPAQWNFIWIRKGGKATFTNTIIKNATSGIFIEGNGNEVTPNLVLENVQVYNSQTVGIQSNASFISGSNVVINQSGRSSINVEEGGTYNFTHSTFSNTFSFGASSQSAIVLNNTPKKESDVVTTDLGVTFVNCIISGNKSDEIKVTNSNEASFSSTFENCLINLRSNSPELDTENTAQFINCIFNEKPKFQNTSLNMLQIEDESPANGKAKFIIGTDLIGTQRIAPSDIGAYESIIFKKKEDKN